MSQSTSHLITSQPTTKPLTTLLLHQHITSQSQSTNPSHQCTMRSKTHMLSQSTSQYMLSQCMLSQYRYTVNVLIQSTLTHNLTMSLRYTTLHIIPLSMEKRPTAHLTALNNQSETTNMSSHTDQNRCALTPMQHLCKSSAMMIITMTIQVITAVTMVPMM